MRQVVLDTETTGLSHAEGHRVIEIGCVELLNRRVTGRRYHQYLNPSRAIESEAEQVHGITLEFLQDKPVFSSIAAEFMAFINGAELIIHNAPFDVGFIDCELELTGERYKKLSTSFQIIDTLVLARANHPGQRNSLDALCKRYGVDNSRRELHGALLDAHLLAQVYLAMTGGQASFFDGMAPTEVDSVSQGVGTEEVIQVVMEENQIPLRVIYPDDQEMAAHQDRLKGMQGKGKCLWELV